MLTVVTTGDWPAGKVISRWGASALSMDNRPDAMSRIERAWQLASARPGIHLFDGPMCRLDRWEVHGDVLELSLSPTTYKQFLGTNMADPDQFAPEELANPLGLSPALLSADGVLMFGRRSGAVAYYPNRVHPFAGALEPTDRSVFDGMLRELREELRLEPSDLSEQRCIGIVSDNRLRQPEMIFYVRTQRTSREMAMTLETLEHRACVAVPARQEAIEAALSDCGAMTPVAVGTLLLFGRRCFGGEWFDRQSARLGLGFGAGPV